MSAKTNKHHHQFPAALGRRYATIADAAEYLGVSPITIRSWVADGRLRAFNGASWRVLRVDLNEVDLLMAGEK